MLPHAERQGAAPSHQATGLELLDELKGRCPVVIFSAQIPDRAITEQVVAALTKSVTSNEQLLATIKKSLNMNAVTEQ